MRIGEILGLSLDELDFDNVSEDDLLDVDDHVSVDEVSSSSNEMSSSSEEESEEKEEDIHAWGGRKSNYYGGMEDVACYRFR